MKRVLALLGSVDAYAGLVRFYLQLLRNSVGKG